MRIESLSIKSATVMIFSMIGLVAIVLSLFAGSYFKQAALDSQMNSLSRVIEVAAEEVLREIRTYTFDFGMKLGHSKEIVDALKHADQPASYKRLVALLDDPFINGFVGFANINLEKIRIYDLDYRLVAASSRGLDNLSLEMPAYLQDIIKNRQGVDRLKAVDALWLSVKGPLNSTLLPIGGLRQVGYLEIVIDPAFNLPDIGKITKTPVNIFSMSGEQINSSAQTITDAFLPVEYIMSASGGQPAFRIVGYENVAAMNQEMETTQFITTGSFLLLSLVTLLFALWLFNRFLFVPLGQMMNEMKQMAQGKLDSIVHKKGLQEFSVLAESFDAMANQVRLRTSDLERLLDLDGSAILCFAEDNSAVYFNKSAVRNFGYASDEIADLDMADLFTDDVNGLMKHVVDSSSTNRNQLHIRLGCRHKDGSLFQSEAVINHLDVMAGRGYAIVLNPVSNEVPLVSATQEHDTKQSEQRMHVIEQSLNSILALARNNPGLIAGLANVEQLGNTGAVQEDDKSLVREQVVKVMTAALACWEHDLGRSKLALAEASKIWPVYIDKSTPTTRTLDKYLQLESCPKNPRRQRVIDTAEFVLRQTEHLSTAYRQTLLEELETFRSLLSGA